MAHYVEQMAYIGQTPWHGLGNQLANNQPLKYGRNRQGWTGILKSPRAVYR